MSERRSYELLKGAFESNIKSLKKFFDLSPTHPERTTFHPIDILDFSGDKKIFRFLGYKLMIEAVYMPFHRLGTMKTYLLVENDELTEIKVHLEDFEMLIHTSGALEFIAKEMVMFNGVPIDVSVVQNFPRQYTAKLASVLKKIETYYLKDKGLI